MTLFAFTLIASLLILCHADPQLGELREVCVCIFELYYFDFIIFIVLLSLT